MTESSNVRGRGRTGKHMLAMSSLAYERTPFSSRLTLFFERGHAVCRARYARPTPRQHFFERDGRSRPGMSYGTSLADMFRQVTFCCPLPHSRALTMLSNEDAICCGA